LYIERSKTAGGRKKAFFHWDTTSKKPRPAEPAQLQLEDWAVSSESSWWKPSKASIFQQPTQPKTRQDKDPVHLYNIARPPFNGNLTDL
jgi:hypothetical protein